MVTVQAFLYAGITDKLYGVLHRKVAKITLKLSVFYAGALYNNYAVVEWIDCCLSDKSIKRQRFMLITADSH